MILFKKPIVPAFVFLVSLNFFVRFWLLDFHGVWGDEIATAYFINHPTEIFLHESHSLFYHLLYSPVAIFGEVTVQGLRIYQAILLFLLSTTILFRSIRLFTFNEWFFINLIYLLHPAVLGFVRLARPYGPLIDLTMFFIIESRLFNRILWIYLCSFLLSIVHPLGFIPIGFEILSNSKLRTIWKGIFISLIPFGAYYFLKFMIGTNQLMNVSWIKRDGLTFFTDLNGLLVGSYFPFYQVLTNNHGNMIFLGLLVASICISIFSKKAKKKDLVQFIALYAFIIIFFNFMSYAIDLRINRYFAFLIPFSIIAIVRLLANVSHGRIALSLISGTLFLQLFYFNPYFSKKDSFGSFVEKIQELSEVNGHLPVLGCGYPFHNWYFKNNAFHTCDNPETIEYFRSFRGKFILAYHDGQIGPVSTILNNVKFLGSVHQRDGDILLLDKEK